MAANQSRRKFTPEQEQAIIADYASGMSSPQVARKWNCGHAIVQRIIRRNGGKLRSISVSRRVPRPERRRFSPEEETVIRKEYEARVSTSRLAKKYNAKACTINGVIRRAGGVIRTMANAQRGKPMIMPLRCTLNEAAFDNAESDPVATYFAGLLFADGCVEEASNNQRPDITLRLKKSDIEMIRSFRDFLGSSHKIGFSKNGSASLSVSSQKIADALLRFGLTPRKSLTAEVPEFLWGNRDWWRGVIDGDGWVFFTGEGIPAVGVCGTLQTCESFLSFVRTITPTKVKPQRSLSIWAAPLKHLHAIRVAHALYANCPIALERKRVAAEKMMTMGQAKGILPVPS